MAVKDIVKGICNITRCKYDVYTKEKTDELLETKANADTTTVTTAGENLDDYTKTGVYYFSSNHTPVNVPSGVNGWLVVYGNGYTTKKQIWYRAGTSGSFNYEPFMRTCGTTGVWSEWEKIVTEPVVLWEGSQKLSAGKITLKDSVANYKRVVIYYQDNQLNPSVNHAEILGKSSNTYLKLTTISAGTTVNDDTSALLGVNVFLRYVSARITGDGINLASYTGNYTQVVYGTVEIKYSGGTEAISAEDPITITKVVGYKF